MSPDEWTPSVTYPQQRRALRLDIERPGGNVALTVEEPQSAAEVVGFYNVVRDVLELPAAEHGGAA